MKNPEVIRKKGLSEQKVIMINRRLPNIIVPKNKQSLDLLFENNDMDSDYITFPIGREDLNELFETGIFNRMNERLNIIIDTYEKKRLIAKSRSLKIFHERSGSNRKHSRNFSEGVTVITV